MERGATCAFMPSRDRSSIVVAVPTAVSRRGLEGRFGSGRDGGAPIYVFGKPTYDFRRRIAGSRCGASGPSSGCTRNNRKAFLASAFLHFGLLLRYTQALITQVAQTAACNRRHSLDQRLCRWLLMMCSIACEAPRS